MVELPRGETVENRRGGPDVLQTLVRDQFGQNGTGYIRIERIPNTGHPRIGQLVIKDGKPLAAIHEQAAIRHGVEALIEIEDDALFLQSQLSVVKDVEIELIAQLHPDALLNISMAWDVDSPLSSDKHWWEGRKATEIKWSTVEELPEYETVVETPEFIQRAAAIKRAQMQGELAGELLPGHVHLLDAERSDDAYKLAFELASIGRPLLVISRTARESISVEYNIPSSSCWWLSERPGNAEQSLGPRFEEISRVVNDFLWGNLRAVVLFDGMEFLSSIHGTERMLGFLRRIADDFNDSDNLLLIPADLLVWPEKERRKIQRVADEIPSRLVSFWLQDPELLSQHPFCAPPSEEESKWIEDSLKSALEIRNKPLVSTGEINYPPQPTAQLPRDDEGQISSTSTSAIPSEEILGFANKFSAGELARQLFSEDELLNDDEKSISIDSIEQVGPSEDWIPTFHSAAPPRASQSMPAEPHSPQTITSGTEEKYDEEVATYIETPHEKYEGLDEGCEVEVTVNDIPAAVLQTLHNHLPRGDIISAELEVEDGQMHYELNVYQDGVEYEIEITPEGFVVELEVESRQGPRSPVYLGQRKDLRSGSKSTEQISLNQNELSAAATLAEDISTRPLEHRVKLNDRLAKAKQALEAISTASISAGIRVTKAQLPRPSGDIERERVVGEWNQVANSASLPQIKNEVQEPRKLPDSWSAAALHIGRSKNDGLENMEGIGSPLSARPGIEIASEDRGREMSRRRQRDMSLSAISRRIAEQDAERMREEKGAKVVTNNRGADK